MDLHMMLKIANEEGIEIGEEKGAVQERLKNIRALQDNGMSFEDTCRLLKLTEEEILYVKQQDD
ncbi:MAG: hypothetical protein K6G61_03460 [Solobacterium sp.]|nr:hypothetical protein [Solobacterium sp.]